MPQCAPVERSSALIGGQGPLIRAHGRWRIETRPDSAVEGACGRHAWEGSRRALQLPHARRDRLHPRHHGQRAPQGWQGHLERLRRRDPERAAYARGQRQGAEARGGPGRRRRRGRDHRDLRDPGRPPHPGPLEDRRVHEARPPHRGALRREARGESVRVRLRLAARQPRRLAPAGHEDQGLARRVAGEVREPRREARPHRPLNGRTRRASLHRVPRGLARHAHPRHDRDAVRGLPLCARHARQRQEGEVLRPDGDRALADRGLPAAADLPLLRRRRRQARARRGGADPEPRPGQDEGRARVPPRDPRRRRRRT